MVLNPATRRITILLATLVGVSGTFWLGHWQLDRAAQKVALQAVRDANAAAPVLGALDLASDAVRAPAQQGRRVHLLGHWDAAHSVFLDNRQMKGRVGFILITPFRLADRPAAVLVQRGWTPRDPAQRAALPQVPTPSGEVALDGRVAPPPSRLFEFQPQNTGILRQNLDIAEFSAETGLRLLPLSVQLSDSPTTAGDALSREWPRIAVNIDMHYGYAFQWFALSALMTGLYVWFQLLRPRFRPRARGGRAR